jgi:hypothetical protein
MPSMTLESDSCTTGLGRPLPAISLHPGTRTGRPDQSPLRQPTHPDGPARLDRRRPGGLRGSVTITVDRYDYDKLLGLKTALTPPGTVIEQDIEVLAIATSNIRAYHHPRSPPPPLDDHLVDVELHAGPQIRTPPPATSVGQAPDPQPPGWLRQRAVSHSLQRFDQGTVAHDTNIC